MGIKTLEIPLKSKIFIEKLDVNSNSFKIAKAAILDELEKTNYQHNRNSNVKAAYVSDMLLHVENYKFSFIVDEVKNRIKELFDLEYYFLDKDGGIQLRCNECWFAVYEKSNFAHKHCHIPCFFSACVYFLLEENSSKIYFEDTALDIEEGSLVMFPSHINHSVPETNGKRIVLAMNFMAE